MLGNIQALGMGDIPWFDKGKRYKERKEKMTLENDKIELKWDSFKWSCTIGVNAGYKLQNQKMVTEDEFAKSYGKIAKERPELVFSYEDSEQKNCST